MKKTLEHIWEQFHVSLHGYVNKRVSNPQDADDILSEVFLKIYKNIHTLKDEEYLSSWLYRITHNTIIDYYRKREKQQIVFDDSKLGEEIYEENSTDYIGELSECIEVFINKLGENDKKALHYTEILGHTQKQLADEMGVSLSGAKSRVQRARKKVQDMLYDCCEFERGKGIPQCSDCDN